MIKPRLVNLRFGDVIRVDEAQNPEVKQPDKRRWVILGKVPDGRWLTAYIDDINTGPNLVIIYWPSALSGFRLADEPNPYSGSFKITGKFRTSTSSVWVGIDPAITVKNWDTVTVTHEEEIE